MTYARISFLIKKNFIYHLSFEELSESKIKKEKEVILFKEWCLVNPS